jgi:hypothetical protein
MRLPIGLAVDDRDYIYVADGELSKIFVFQPDGDFDPARHRRLARRPSALAMTACGAVVRGGCAGP